MITKLDHLNIDIATRIHSVFQQSYKIEAALIGTNNFPPLKRSVKDITLAETCFYGFLKQDKLAAVIEIEILNKRLDINSLTVSPDFFRQGIADKLLHHVFELFDLFDITHATVETAVVNAPAIKLYQKHGFVEYKRWTPSHGIEKLAFALTPHRK